ncbi:MAG: hypothetical protein JNL21_32175 [Myxococcales bacterium]|nr:hypothetical protein [Myxococcales bacterium]
MTMSDPVSNPVPALQARAAYAAIKPELEAMDGKNLIGLNLDVAATVVTVLGCMPELRLLKSRLIEDLPKVDPNLFEKTEQYAYALRHADTLHTAASTPSEPIAEIAAQLKDIHGRLEADARALAQRKLIDPDRLAFLTGVRAFQSMTSDVFLLVELFRKNWSTIAGKTAVTADELDTAERLAERLDNAVGVREQGPAGVPEAAENRRKAFHLFMKAYDETRRVVGFLRWHEKDADTIAPSLFAARMRKSGSEIVTEPVPAPVPVPAPTNGAAPQPAPAVTEPNAAPGMPGNPPFIRN